MAKLITKFKYLKPNGSKDSGGYARYIATREGVEKIDESFKLKPSTVKQKELIKKILKDFPDCKEMLEYEDYLNNKTMGNASEFITRALEDNADEVMSTTTYADYIATRPRVEKYGTHGLFTNDGVVVNLNEVSDELKEHEGNVWTAIISLRREDAERLNFSNGDRWRILLRSHAETFATHLKIPMENMKWYAAFHNESYHPHVHLIAYSKVAGQGFLTHKSLLEIRSKLANDIFSMELYNIFQRQTEHRDELRKVGREKMERIVKEINSGIFDNPKLESMLSELAIRLEGVSGRKQYGYLPKSLKALVIQIVNELAKDERIVELYDLWYDLKEETIKIYTDDLPKRVPLADNKEFNSIRNAVVKEALNMLNREITADEIDLPDDVENEQESEADEPVEAPPLTEYEKLKLQAASGNKWSQYGLAKLLLDNQREFYDPTEAIEWLMESAKNGYTVAKYKLGKMFLKGEHIEKNVDYALRWLEDAVRDKNHYAEYLLGKTYLKGEDVDQDNEYAFNLLRSSAMRGNIYANYTLGKELIDGINIPADVENGVGYVKLSADKGFPPAQYLLGKLLYKGEYVPRDIEKALGYLESAAEQENSYASYLAGKIRITEDAFKDVNKAIYYFEIAAKQGNDYAEYQLGKIYLYGNGVEKDYDKAMEYLHSAADKGNIYAEQLIHSIESNRNWSTAIATLNLFYHLSRMLKDNVEDECGGRKTDRKLKRAIDQKKQALGIRIS